MRKVWMSVWANEFMNINNGKNNSHCNSIYITIVEWHQSLRLITFWLGVDGDFVAEIMTLFCEILGDLQSYVLTGPNVHIIYYLM